MGGRVCKGNEGSPKMEGQGKRLSEDVKQKGNLQEGSAGGAHLLRRDDCSGFQCC